MPHRYEILDVFTATPLAGNPLAVVHDADSLDSPRMQAIAAEFNLSETVFLSSSAAGHSAAARIFTPKRELPFAGHPTIGAAVALAARENAGAVTIELSSGLVRASVADGRALFDVPQLATLFGEGLDPAPIAFALRLPQGVIGFAGFTPAHASVGPSFTMVPVDHVDRLAAIEPDTGGWDDAFASAFPAVYVFAPAGAQSFRARMFAPRDGIVEDPATGSAAVAFASLWTAMQRPADGVHRLDIVQGVEMGRRSEIGLEAEVAGGLLTRVRLSGHAVKIAKGTLLL